MGGVTNKFVVKNVDNAFTTVQNLFSKTETICILFAINMHIECTVLLISGVFNNNLTTDNILTFYETYTPDRSVLYKIKNILFSENPKITTEKKLLFFVLFCSRQCRKLEHPIRQSPNPIYFYGRLLNGIFIFFNLLI